MPFFVCFFFFFKKKDCGFDSLCLHYHFTISKAQNPEISDFYVNKKVVRQMERPENCKRFGRAAKTITLSEFI